MTAVELLTQLENNIKAEELYHFAKLLNREYKVGLTDKQIWRLIFSIFGHKYEPIFKGYIDSLIANDVVNNIVMRYYPGERTVKYHFVKSLINKIDTVTLFEMYADSSRADLCRINHKSIAYEIKTEVDSLNRLPKQVEDYSKLFEYVYVILNQKHFEKARNMLPSHVGIINYRLDVGNCIFSNKKKAIKSPFLDSNAQIRNLSSNDMMLILKKHNVKDIPIKKSERVNLLLTKFNNNQINSLFKSAVKLKYQEQWAFIKKHFFDIYPIDIQSFFHSPIDPKLIYYKA